MFKASGLNNNPNLVFEIKKGEKSLHWSATKLSNNNLYKNIELSDKYSGGLLNIYVWQNNKTENFELTEFSLNINANKEFLINKIKNDKKWLESVKLKALNNGISLDEQIELDADWIINNK
jgi:hypothetical protein